jgi:hypothetical protein
MIIRSTHQWTTDYSPVHWSTVVYWLVSIQILLVYMPQNTVFLYMWILSYTQNYRNNSNLVGSAFTSGIIPPEMWLKLTTKDTCKIQIKSILCVSLSSLTDETFNRICHLHVRHSVCHPYVRWVLANFFRRWTQFWSSLFLNTYMEWCCWCRKMFRLYTVQSRLSARKA